MKTFCAIACLLVATCAVTFQGPYTGAKWSITSDGEKHEIQVTK